MAKKEEKKTSELLQIEGVGEGTVSKLSEAGISTLMALATCSPSDVASTAGMSEAAARKIIQAARESLKLGFEKASEFSKKRDKIKKISTGCKALDVVLGGGFESGAISEIYGQFGTGKTQLAHLLVVRALVEDPKNKAFMLDTENTFRKERIIDFAIANKLDPDDALNRIYVSRAYNSDHQMLLVDEIEKILQKDPTYRIIVVDSLTSHFRSEFSGRGELASRQQKLNTHMHQLLRLADLYNLVVLCSNQVMSNPGASYGDPTKPIGGHIVGHNSAFRIYFRPGKEGSTYFKLVDSPNLPNGEGNFIITKDGLEDV